MYTRFPVATVFTQNRTDGETKHQQTVMLRRKKTPITMHATATVIHQQTVMQRLEFTMIFNTNLFQTILNKKKHQFSDSSCVI